MLTQEEYMDVLKLAHEGFSITEIAEELGYHPATISRSIKAGGPPPVSAGPVSERSRIGTAGHGAVVRAPVRRRGTRVCEHGPQCSQCSPRHSGSVHV